jgi:hypothetical protein
MESLQIKEIQVYFLSVEGNFNDYVSQHPGVSEIDTTGIVDMYMKKFAAAWDELAEK